MSSIFRLRGHARPLAALLVFLAAWAAAPASAGTHFAIPRYAQSAALLTNRKVLVVGGMSIDGSTALSSVEMLDTTNGSEFVTNQQGFVDAPMGVARASATITVLPNGKVLVTGGWNGASGALTSGEVYTPNPAGGAGSWAPASNTMGATGRFNHTATLLLTGNVLICGGQTALSPPAATAVLSSCYLYRPATNDFAATGSLLLGRALHSATILSDGSVWIAGGYNPDPAQNSNAPYVVTTERYSAAAGSWQQAQPLNASRAYHTATLTGDNKVLVAGGVNTNISVDTFTFVLYPNASPQVSTTIFVPRLGRLNSTELFDPTGGAIVPGPPLLARTESHAAALLPSGLVSVYGGRGNIAPKNLKSITPSPVFTSGSAIAGTFTTLTSSVAIHTITAGNGSVPLKFYLDPAMTGDIIDGDVEFINPFITVTGGVVRLTSNFDTPGTGLRASLKGTTAGCDTAGACGLVNTTLPLTNLNTGTYEFIEPVSGANGLASQGVTGSLTISTSPTGLPIFSGVTSVIAGSFSTKLQITVPGFLAGKSISNVSLSLGPTATAGWTETSSYTVVLSSGAGFAAGPFAVQTAAGASYISIPSFTFNNLGGSFVVISPDPTWRINNATLATIPTAGGTARMDSLNFSMTFSASGIDLSGQTLSFDSVNVVIRDMIFGDDQFFSPSVNQWSFQPPKTVVSRPGLAQLGPSSVVTTSGLELDIGGRHCTAGCAGLEATNVNNGIDPIYRYDSHVGGFIPAGANLGVNQDLLTHAFHTATLLTDGTILLAGGTNGATVLPNAEVFDPKTQGFALAATTLKYPRQQHSASLMPNGRVLLAGGFTTLPSTGPTNTAEIYFPDTRVFLETAPMISSHSQHVAVTLPNGNVFVAGGYKGLNTVTGSAEIYSSTSVAWTAAADMTTLGANRKRAISAGVQLKDGRIMLCGGTNESGILSSVIAYDPSANSWADLAPMPSALRDHTATLLFDGRVLVAGGNDGFGETASSFVYDPTGNTWTVVNPLGTPRFGHSATLLPNGSVLVSGGVQQSALVGGSAANAVKDLEFYLPELGAWGGGRGGSVLSQGARAFQTTTLGSDGQLYFLGGADGSIGTGQSANFYTKFESMYFTLRPDQDSKTQPSLRQSTITTTTAFPILPGASFNITGLRFRGATEASGGSGSANSSFSTPFLMLRKIDGSDGGGSSSSPGFVADLTPLVYANAANQSTLDSSLTVTLPSNNALPYGWYQTWVGATDIHTNQAPFVQVGPLKPTGTVAIQNPTVIGISSVTYAWTWPGTGPTPDGYNVYSATTGVFITSIAYAGVGITSFTQTGLMPNTTTSILVGAYTLTGDGPLSASATTYTFSTAPINVRITSVTFNSLLLQWDSNGNTAGTVYEVSQSTDWPSPFSQSVSTPVSHVLFTMGNQVAIGQLLMNTTYTFRLQAFNTANLPSTFSVWATTATRSAVSGVLGKALDSSSIVWSWNDAGPVTYKVYNATSNAVLISTTATSFTQAGLGVNTIHAIAVSAVTGAGEGPLSAVATTYTLANTPGLLNPALTSLTTFSFTLGWGPNGNPPGTPFTVALYEYLDSGINVATFSSTGFTFNTTSLAILKANVRYDAYITAYNGEPVPIPSASLLISTYTLADRPRFVAPVFFTVTPTTIGLKWDTVGNSTHTFYEVTDSTDPAFAIALATAVPFSAAFTGSSTTLTGLITSDTYYIRVRAMNQLGQTSQYSFSTNTVTVNGGAPPGSLAGPLLAQSNSELSGNLGDGRFVDLVSPAGAFPSDTTATLTPFNVVAGTTLCPNGFNVAVIVTDNPGLQPTAPLYLTADYDPTVLGVVPTGRVALARVVDAGSYCVPLETDFFSAAPRPRFRARLNHFSTYQLVQIPLAASAGTVRVFPNPYRAARDGYVTIDQVPPGARVRIMTMRGETILDQLANSYGMISWSGTNGAGRSVASGLYIVLIEAGGSMKTAKLAVVR